MVRDSVRERDRGRARDRVRLRDRDRQSEPDRRSEAINFGANSDRRSEPNNMHHLYATALQINQTLAVYCRLTSRMISA